MTVPAPPMVNARSTQTLMRPSRSGWAAADVSRRSAARSSGRPAPVLPDTAMGFQLPRPPKQHKLTQPFEHLRANRTRIGQIAAGDGNHPVADPERVQRRDVLGGLRLPAAVSGDDEQGRRHRTDAGEHRGQELVMSRNIDERDRFVPGRQDGPDVAEFDRQPTAAFLLQPVGLHAGERAYEGRLAVVDVAGGGDDMHRQS